MLWYETQIESTRKEFRLNMPSSPLQEIHADACQAAVVGWVFILQTPCVANYEQY